MSEYIYRSNGEPLANELGEISLALEGEIVRCRDCRWYREEWIRKLMRDRVYCDWLDGAHVEPDGFCAWGERLENDVHGWRFRLD